MTGPRGAERDLLAIDTATSRVVVCRGAVELIEDGRLAGWLSARRVAPATVERLLARVLSQAAIGCRRRRHRSGSVHRAARGDRDGQGPGPRAGVPLVGVSTADALLAAAPEARPAAARRTRRPRAGRPGGRRDCCPAVRNLSCPRADPADRPRPNRSGTRRCAGTGETRPRRARGRGASLPRRGSPGRR